MQVDAYLFDVEGTLVDSVHQTLRCWQETLHDAGKALSLTGLHAFSGMDGRDMLKMLVPEFDDATRQALVEQQGRRFEQHYLGSVRPLPGARATLLALRGRGRSLALATDCKGAALRHYRKILSIDDLLDTIVCGDDVPEGKPNPKLIVQALSALGGAPGESTMVGDTPFDAEAAAQAGVACIGVTTGGFSRDSLLASGCQTVIEDVRALANAAASV